MATPSDLLARHELLSHDDEIRLARRVQEGDGEARDRLAESNIRLVHKIASRYRNCGLEYEELFGWGTVGLMEAVDRYDPERGYRFSTYASHWIRQAITRAISTYSRTIRLPEHLRQDLRQMEDEYTEMIRETGEAPTDEDLAELTDATPEHIRDLRALAQVGDSLDRELVEDEGHSTLADMLGLDEPGPEELAHAALTHDVLWKLMVKTLPIRQLMILTWRASTDRTLESLTEVFNLSRERVRQLECDALERVHGELRRRGVDSQIALADLHIDEEIKNMDIKTLEQTPPEDRALVAAILQFEDRLKRDEQELQYLKAYVTGGLPQANHMNGDENAHRDN